MAGDKEHVISGTDGIIYTSHINNTQFEYSYKNIGAPSFCSYNQDTNVGFTSNWTRLINIINIKYYEISELVPASKDSTQKNIQSDETAGAESHPDPAVVNFTYEQVARIQELHSQLLEEPNVLQEKYKYLEKLGQDVSQSIAELKEAADTVLNKATK